MPGPPSTAELIRDAQFAATTFDTADGEVIAVAFLMHVDSACLLVERTDDPDGGRKAVARFGQAVASVLADAYDSGECGAWPEDWTGDFLDDDTDEDGDSDDADTADYDEEPDEEGDLDGGLSGTLEWDDVPDDDTYADA